MDTIENLKAWFERLLVRGPLYGYFPQPKKCVLIVKPEKEASAKEMFKNTGIEITTVGKRHLGAALGSASFKKEFVAQVKTLSKFAVTQPHAAFSAFTHCLQGRWTFVSRTVPDAGPLLTELEKAIREDFIPALLGPATRFASCELCCALHPAALHCRSAAVHRSGFATK